MGHTLLQALNAYFQDYDRFKPFSESSYAVPHILKFNVNSWSYMNKILESINHAIVGVACCLFVVIAICLEFPSSFVGDIPFFLQAQKILDFLKTGYSLVNVGFVVLLSIYSVVRIALAVLGFKRYVLDKQLQEN